MAKSSDCFGKMMPLCCAAHISPSLQLPMSCAPDPDTVCATAPDVHACCSTPDTASALQDCTRDAPPIPTISLDALLSALAQCPDDPALRLELLKFAAEHQLALSQHAIEQKRLRHDLRAARFSQRAMVITFAINLIVQLASVWLVYFEIVRVPPA